MHVITDDDRGEMMDGLFYYLLPTVRPEDYEFTESEAKEEGLDHPPTVVYPPGTEEELMDLLSFEYYDYESEEVPQCSLNKEHLSNVITINTDFDLYFEVEGGLAGAFIPDRENGDKIIVKEEVKKQFDKMGFTGFAAVSIKKVRTYSTEDIGFKMFALNLLQSAPYRKYRVIPDSENACPYCGISPVCCPECDAIDEHCRNCGEKTLFTSKENGELGFYIEYNDKSLGDIGAMGRPYPYLDGSLWNGSDFMSGNIVTGRVRDYCVKNKLGPVVFWKMNTYVGSCTPAQRQKLEAIRSKNP